MSFLLDQRGNEGRPAWPNVCRPKEPIIIHAIVVVDNYYRTCSSPLHLVETPAGVCMGKKKTQIRHAEIVQRFGARLRELRRSRGLTQAQLAQEARLTASYVGRLEAGGASPGIDLVQRLADALGTTIHDLLPTEAPPETEAVLKERARKLFDELLKTADRETLLMLCPLLARLGESPTRRR
jgi:transcriptional regulator with XRE-family HTH domain